MKRQHPSSTATRVAVVFASLLAISLGGPPQARAKPIPVGAALDAEVQAAVDKGRAYLLSQLATQPDGRASLVGVALLKGGLPKETPAIQGLLAAICERCKDGKFKAGSDHIYDAGVTLMALASADKDQYKSEIQVIAKYIIDFQGPNGDWDYIARVAGDTSISQYAMLGLWEAARAGVQIPLEVWDRAATWHVSRQMTDGGFTYHPSPDPTKNNASSHSMTVAGVGSLCIARRYLFPNSKDRGAAIPALTDAERRGVRFGVLERVLDEEPKDQVILKARLSEIDQAIQKGIRWLTNRFTVDKPTGFPIYYLYGLERMTALAGLQKVGDHDWFAEGARHLIATQQVQGNWQEASTPSGPVASTCFAYLFLTKATAIMLAKERAPEFGAGLLAGGRGLPDNLADVQVKQGKVEARKIEGDFDKLLAELENPQSAKLEAAQSGLVDKILSEPREKLIGQKDRLLKLAVDPRPDVRRTAMWALGRSGGLRIAPTLIKALEDKDPDVAIEARLALRVLSRKANGLSNVLPPADEPPKPAEIEAWQAWYRTVRPYDERDDLSAVK